MLASATEVEVELDVPQDTPTFFGVTWAQHLQEDKIVIKAFPRTADGRMGLLEATGLVETGDCLTAINGTSLTRATPLSEVMAGIRSAKSPLTLRFARYPSAPYPNNMSSTITPGSPGSYHSNHNPRSSSTSTQSVSGGGTEAGDLSFHASPGEAGGIGDATAEDAELDAVMNSPLVLGLSERVAGIQRNNARLLQAADHIGRAAAAKRAGVESVASAAADLNAAAGGLPRALKALAAARENASTLCETMARLDESLAARERAAANRRRMNEERGATDGVSRAMGKGGPPVR